MNKIFGRKPVLEKIKSGAEIEQVIIAYGQHGDIIGQIKNEAYKRGIKVSEISTSKFDNQFKGENTQGVAALISDQRYYELDEIIASAKSKTYPLLLILDTIQDPHNLGAILRTAECAGVDGVIMTTNNSASITETAEKTSAGAVSYLKICKVNNLNNAMKELKDNGFWIVGSYLGNSKDYNEVDYKMPVALVMGNEEKGLRKLVAENCDFLVHIPMHGKIDSLNVSVATGVLLFGILKQRNK